MVCIKKISPSIQNIHKHLVYGVKKSSAAFQNPLCIRCVFKKFLTSGAQNIHKHLVYMYTVRWDTFFFFMGDRYTHLNLT